MSDSIEEYLAQMHGRIEALTLIAMALLATHPDGRATLLAAKIRDHANAIPTDENPQQAAFAKGMLEVSKSIEGGLKFAEYARQTANLKTEGGH